MANALAALFGDKLVSKGGEVDTATALAGKTAVGIYFSAHWCPPCRGFTPQLAEFYKDSLQAKGMEIVFVSGDQDQEAFEAYYGEMPWFAVNFTSEDLRTLLKKKFKIQGIPALVIVDSEGKTITKNGRNAVMGDTKGEQLPWRPEPRNEALDVVDLRNGMPKSMNDTPTILVFCEQCSKGDQDEVLSVLKPLAKRYLDAAGGDDPECCFSIATHSDGLTAKIRSMVGIDAEGQAGQPAKLVLLDIWTGGTFFEAPDGEITSNLVEAFIADTKAGTVERKKMGD